MLNEQREMRQFRRRGLEKVAVEMSLAAAAYNLTRAWHTPQAVRELGWRALSERPQREKT